MGERTWRLLVRLLRTLLAFTMTDGCGGLLGVRVLVSQRHRHVADPLARVLVRLCVVVA